MSFEELAPHIYTLSEQPEAIPYMTSYYKERWGFCMTHKDFLSLPKEGIYHAFIDSKLDSNGSLTYGDVILPGESKMEIVFSTYICHPSLANNELSGPLVATFLYKQLNQLKNRFYTYRFIFTPETIGTITYLSKHGSYLKENIHAGLIITCAGDQGKFTYKKSKKENTEINKVVEHILKHYAKKNHKVVEFIPIGSDERQYCSPGFNLPFGSLMRTMYGEYKEYHTSADNKEFISFPALMETIQMYYKICQTFEINHKYVNLYPYGEPFLSRHDLYPDINIGSGKKDQWLRQILFILNYSDGKTSLLEIAEKLQVPILDLCENINLLVKKKLLKF
jgi:aminopeptidase-like protein